MKDLDCTGMDFGDDGMPLKPDNLYEYDTIVCDSGGTIPGNVGDLYRFMDDGIRLYPTFPIAASWDPDWETNAKSIDCTGFDVTDDMPPYPLGVEEGGAVSCILGTDESGARPTVVYRFSKGKLRHYPIPEIAYSWDTTWQYSVVKFDCTGLKTGPTMTAKPVDLEEGDAIKCINNSDESDNANKVYRYTDEKIRWYPNPPVAYSWDLTWPIGIKFIDCDGVPIGYDMSLLLKA